MIGVGQTRRFPRCGIARGAHLRLASTSLSNLTREIRVARLIPSDEVRFNDTPCAAEIELDVLARLPGELGAHLVDTVLLDVSETVEVDALRLRIDDRRGGGVHLIRRTIAAAVRAGIPGRTQPANLYRTRYGQCPDRFPSGGWGPGGQQRGQSHRHGAWGRVAVSCVSVQ